MSRKPFSATARWLPPRDEELEYVVISDRARQALRALSHTGNLSNEGVTQLPDGSWRVPFQKETLARLRKEALAGESYSDTIERVLTTLPKDGTSRRRLQ